MFENRRPEPRHKGLPTFTKMTKVDINKINTNERSNLQNNRQKLSYNKDKQISADTNSTKRTSSPFLDRNLLQQAVKGEQKKKNWDYFEINHPKAISDKKLQELKAKYQRRRTEGTLILEKDKRVEPLIPEESRLDNTETKKVSPIPICGLYTSFTKQT